MRPNPRTILSRDPLIAVLIATVMLSTAPAWADDISRAIITQLGTDAATGVGPTHQLPPIEQSFLRRIYTLSDNNPLWLDKSEVAEFLGLLTQAAEDGLDPNDYHLSRLETLIADGSQSPAAKAGLDILLTDAFARFAYHQRFGKANPLEIDQNWNFSRAFVTDDPALWIRHAITTQGIRKSIDWLRPNIQHYRTLKSALTAYREFSQAGPWPIIPPGPTLKPGMSDPRIALVIDRLTAENYPIQSTNVEKTYFDKALETNLREFQRRHGLFEDGFLGTKTLRALNVPLARRIDQIRINMERVRWLFRDLEDEYIVVNIAAFTATYSRLGVAKWRARAVVGRPYRQTPSFKATLTHMVINPTWTVPPTILREDILPAMIKNPDYLSRKGLRLYEKNGSPIDPTTLDWQALQTNGFPYYIKQGPGENNALGRIKFMFPNPHLVYLHDTPSRQLFARAERTFSSGCIRVEHPFQLATTLLNRSDDWLPSDIEKLVNSGQPRRVDLDRPITVMMLYLTAYAAEDSQIEFRRDVYSRDAAVLTALNGPFKFAPPSGY